MSRLAPLVTLALVCGLTAKEIKVHGYVTSVQSQGQFEIEDFKITRDRALTFELERDKDGDPAPVSFRPDDLSIGTALVITGDYDEKTGLVHAKTARVESEDQYRIKRTA